MLNQPRADKSIKEVHFQAYGLVIPQAAVLGTLNMQIVHRRFVLAQHILCERCAHNSGLLTLRKLRLKRSFSECQHAFAYIIKFTYGSAGSSPSLHE